MTVSILLADDHHVVRQGLRSLLESEATFSVVGEASNGLDAIQMVEQLHPQVVVLDLMMPGLNGLEVTRRIRDLTRVLILSMHADVGYVLEALNNGAYGYLLKDSTATELVQAVKMVSEGRRYLGSPFSDQAISSYAQKSRSMPQDPYDTLTTRERGILQLVVEGHSTNDIAAMLSISSRTVETHRANLMRKLRLNSQVELIRFALRKGILPLDE
ncbi:MAG: response regulator transcription factor [Anaerolineaceae bacterium]|nr:response regulator transcription factor [Anaerolineaceae bacterium]